jgi:hypothetical protein
VHSPIEPSQSNRSPFADPPGTMTNHYQPQPQPSDVGFGYISESDPSRHATYPGVAVEEDDKSARYLTPGTPLKSAMKSPGVPRNIKSPLSPTFREEQILEKQEQLTEKEQAQDLVWIPLPINSMTVLDGRYNVLTRLFTTESKVPRTFGQNRFERGELQLQLDCLIDAIGDIYDLQRDEDFATAQQFACVGAEY